VILLGTVVVVALGALAWMAWPRSTYSCSCPVDRKGAVVNDTAIERPGELLIHLHGADATAVTEIFGRLHRHRG
jgi:hypothetical protein